MGGDLSDEGLPVSTFGIQEARGLHPILRGPPSKDGVPIFGQQGSVLSLPGTAHSRITFQSHRSNANTAAASAVPGGPTDQDAEDIARLFHFQRFAREDIGEQYPLA
jgi:hypothetical protein